MEEIKMLDMIIIGSGPAGLTAAIYAARAGLSALVMEKAPMSGGQITNTERVDNYPGLYGIGGFEMGMKFREHAEKMQAQFTEAEALSIAKHEDFFTVATKEQTYEAKTIILAGGTTYAQLNVEGETQWKGRGVSYCATCDGAFFRNRTTAVVGGGDVAVSDALFLSKMCSRVYVIHRRDSLRAAESLQKKLFSLPNVEVLWDSEVKKIAGSDHLEQIQIVNKKTGEETALSVDGVFVAVGIRPQSEAFADLVKTDENGYFVAGEDCRTNIEGIYAVGDIRTKRLRQVITAAADGANAVASARDYLFKRTNSQEQ